MYQLLKVVKRKQKTMLRSYSRRKVPKRRQMVGMIWALLLPKVVRKSLEMRRKMMQRWRRGRVGKVKVYQRKHRRNRRRMLQWWPRRDPILWVKCQVWMRRFLGIRIMKFAKARKMISIFHATWWWAIWITTITNTISFKFSKKRSPRSIFTTTGMAE